MGGSDRFRVAYVIVVWMTTILLGIDGNQISRRATLIASETAATAARQGQRDQRRCDADVLTVLGQSLQGWPSDIIGYHVIAN